VAVFDRDPIANQRLQKSIPEIKVCKAVDLSDSKQVEQAFLELDRSFGAPDVLVNNAGISLRHKFLEITPDEWQAVIATNLNGVFYVAQQAARRMLENGGGVILNMGSTNGITGYHYYADYNASKAGVIELTRSMALELGPTIRVNAICPGFIMTPMQEAEYTPEMRRAFEAKVPLEKLGKPEDVAALFAFLASDDAAFMSGQCFVIDGGEIAGGLASQR
jgi:NAD(P)-dependent dehydrogenase (short-subunit alcohol dehydrogenase family)